ncbi:carbon-nitrogen hydrolase family protein [Catenovulum sediminis]|uniref:carbon-nitrogen hydrolase family protein n=1 Tax=Catenovulum sediminis TaxID=1740262 RepID=UPI001180C470|nr:carbon-nitrogen hydrolase family protein [Catenovulum sediminis]
MNLSVVTMQMSSTPKVEENLLWLSERFSRLQTTENCLVVLPECFACFGGAENEQARIAEDYGNGPIQDFIAHQARKFNLWIVAGSMPLKIKDSELVYASSLLFSPEGQCQARYNKMHLFDVDVADATGQYRESATTQAGSSITVVETPFAKIGLSICYDVRFPELYRKLQAEGAEIICVPSAFTYVTGQAHWQVLMRARAIENQCFVVAPNQTGTHPNGRQTWGRSVVVDPWGEIVHQHSEQKGYLQSKIDLDRVRQVRSKMPNLQHRKLF